MLNKRPILNAIHFRHIIFFFFLKKSLLFLVDVFISSALKKKGKERAKQ